MRVCAYCNTSGVMTSEHVFSNCLLERSPELDGMEIARKPGTFIRSHQEIKDVCNVCNNDKLSETDSYICSLFDRYMCRYVEAGETVEFEYDYALLARWVAKTAYNAARANGEEPLLREQLASFADFALGEARLPHNLYLLALLVTPYQMTREDRRIGAPDEYSDTGVLPPVGMGANRVVFSHPTVRQVDG